MSRIPEAAVKRLPIYLRVLSELAEERREVVSSADLSRLTGLSSEQIRKDFVHFGMLGKRGVGYRVNHLRHRLRELLGLKEEVRVALVGAGNLGTALARYNLMRQKEVRITAVFDRDWDKVGKKIDHLEILPMEDLERVIREQGIKMAIIAVPPASAQEVADALVEAGVGAILNFSPVRLDGRGKAHVKNIDLTMELEALAFYVGGREKE